MALPALLGGLSRGLMAGGARGAAAAAGRGAIRSGLVRATKSGGGGGDKGGALVKPKQSLSDSAAIVPAGSAITKSAGGGGGALSTTITPKSQKSTAIVKSNLPANDSAIDILRSVKQTAEQILEVEVRDLGTNEEELKERKEQIDDERKLLEQSKREEEQEKQETKKQKPGKRKKSNPIVSAAKKTVGGIWDFLTGILGDFVKYKILDWLSKPENKEKILNIVKFIQSLPVLWGQFKEKFIDPWWNFLTTYLDGGFKLFKSFLTVIVDVFTLKFFTDPKKFLEDLLNIPKTLLEIIPGILDSLLNAVTGGTIKTIGELVDKLFKNPLKGIDFAGIANSLGGFFGSSGNFIKGLAGAAWNGITAVAGSFLGAPAAAAELPPSYTAPSISSQQSSSDTEVSASTTEPSVTGTTSVTPAGETNASKVSGYSITSAYGSKESFRSKSHGGLDIGTPVGTNVALAEDGEIVAAGKYGGYGNLIDAWLPNSGVQLRLAHLSSIIKRNGSFKAGEVIGKTGGAAGDPGAGSSTGPHLHFEMDRQKGGAAYGGSGDPTPFAKLLMLGGGTTGLPKPSPLKPPSVASVATKPQPDSGRSLTEVQRENQILETVAGSTNTTSPIVSNNSTSSQSVVQETAGGTSLGGTLPRSGLWSIYKTNL